MKRMLTALLCLALALSACAAPAAPPEAGASPSAAPAASGAEPLEWLFPPLEATPCGAASETGFYEVLPRDVSGTASPGGYNLCFTDLATLTRVPVCAAPGCAHDSEACTAWLAEDASVAVWNGQLILGNLDGSGFRWLDCMEPDGADRHRLITLPANLSLLEHTTGKLERIDPATGQRTAVGTLPDTDYQVATLLGVWDGRLLVNTWKHLDDARATNVTRQFAVDLTTGRAAELPLPGENRVGEAVPYPLLAEWDSLFLVETGTRRIDSRLAVISKEDFWAGQSAYTPITDAR